MHSDSKLPSDEQRRLLCRMMSHAFVQIRSLRGSGDGTQAAELADAFHNLPNDIWCDFFSLRFFRDAYLRPYQLKYPHAGYYDYLGMLEEVIALEDDSIESSGLASA